MSVNIPWHLRKISFLANHDLEVASYISLQIYFKFLFSHLYILTKYKTSEFDKNTSDRKTKFLFQLLLKALKITLVTSFLWQNI